MAIKGDYLHLLSGMPIMIEDVNIAMTQPRIIDICAYGETKFYTTVAMFTDMKIFISPIKEGNSQLSTLSNFHILMTVLQEDSQIQTVVKEFFGLIFPEYKVVFDFGCIQFKTEESAGFVAQLNPHNIDNFIEVLRIALLPHLKGEEKEFNPQSDKAKEIAAKLNEGRQKRSELKHKKNNTGAMSLLATQISSLSVALGLSFDYLYHLTPFQLFDCYTRYSAKISYEFYQKIISTPLMDTSGIEAPDNWLDDIYK